MRLLEQQTAFFQALAEDGETPADIRGRMGIYRYAYFERLRASIEEDFPLLFEYLETIDFPGGLDAEVVTRDLLTRNHPSSWTLAEASLPIAASIEALLQESKYSDVLAQALKLARVDEAEAMASWLEEWPESKVPSNERPALFAAGRLKLVCTKTWRTSDDEVFWRTDSGVQSTSLASFEAETKLLKIVETPVNFAEFLEVASDSCEPGAITQFLRRGVGEGWLCLIDA